MKFIIALALISLAFGAKATASATIGTDTTKCTIAYAVVLSASATDGQTTIISLFHMADQTIVAADTGITCIVTKVTAAST
jgi:hypothetical protein